MPRLNNKSTNASWIKKTKPYEHVHQDAKYLAFYNSKAWRSLSKRKRTQQPLCESCKAEGKIKACDVADHIKPHRLFPEFSLVYDNLQSLCNSCHQAKSAYEKKIISKRDWYRLTGGGSKRFAK